jgi:glycosyltransferase involved in cell wall biosynthesis
LAILEAWYNGLTQSRYGLVGHDGCLFLMMTTTGDFAGSDVSQNVLLISNSAIGPLMSGPGIRYWEFSRTLSAVANLTPTLVTTPGVRARAPGDESPFRVMSAASERDLYRLASGADVIVAPGAAVSLMPGLQRTGRPLVLDLYIPLLLEELQRTRTGSQEEQALVFERLRRELITQVLCADFMLCASEKQRDYWLGALSALGRVNPFTHADDPTLRRLIDVVPFGLPARPPRHTRQVLKGVYPGIHADDKVVLWGGGIWDWLDTDTLLRAMARIGAIRSDIKLFFMGVKHANQQESGRLGVKRTLSLADELGLEGNTVFFNDWVPYAERSNYLLEADVGISLHQDHLESRFSFRTRFLDNLWAGLPLIASRGDVLSEQVENLGLGRVVEAGDVDGLVTAITALLDTPRLRESYQARFQSAAAAYQWENVIRPLAAFCQHPHRAPDAAYVQDEQSARLGPTPWWRLPGKAWHAFRLGGVAGLTRQLDQYRRWVSMRRGRKHGV